MNTLPSEYSEINKSETETNLEVVINNSDQLNFVFEQLNNSEIIKNHMKLLRENEKKDIKENEMKSKTGKSEQIIDHNSKTIMEPVIHTLELNPNPMYESNKTNKIECPIYTLSNNEIKEDKMNQQEITTNELYPNEIINNITTDQTSVSMSCSPKIENTEQHTTDTSDELTYGQIILGSLINQLKPLDFESLLLKDIYESIIKHNNNASIEESESISFDEWKNLVGPIKVEHKHLWIFCSNELLRVTEGLGFGLCSYNNTIYLYNGEYWIRFPFIEFKNFLGRAANAMGIEKSTADYYQFKESFSKQFMDSSNLTKPIAKTGSFLLNLKNGTFEISNKGIIKLPFNKKDFLTYQLPFNYEPTAIAPLFESFLNKVIPDKQKQRVLAEYLGYIFIKHESKSFEVQKVLFLYGSGANGKSVFYKIVEALIGRQNISNFSLQSLTDEKGYSRAMIEDKLLNYASEINGRVESDVFKKMASGEPIEARLPYGKPLTLTQYAKMLFNCNELPKDTENTDAFFRRFLVIPFDVTIPKTEQDLNLANKIINSELSGVFNWVLAGLNRFLDQNGFSVCDASEKALEIYKMDSNSALQFLDDKNYHKSANQYVLLKNVYIEYREFCMEIGKKPMNKPNLRKQLEMLQYEIKRQGGTGDNIVFLQQGTAKTNYKLNGFLNE